jgi:hypothetical protein
MYLEDFSGNLFIMKTLHLNIKSTSLKIGTLSFYIGGTPWHSANLS